MSRGVHVAPLLIFISDVFGTLPLGRVVSPKIKAASEKSPDLDLGQFGGGTPRRTAAGGTWSCVSWSCLRACRAFGCPGTPASEVSH
jgi:hypothetical protein